MRRLASEVVSIRYRHAKDGELYEHQFKTPTTADVDADGSVVTLRNRAGRKLVADYSMPSGETQMFFPNPRGTTAMAAHRRRRRSARRHAAPVARRRKRRHVARRRTYALALANPRHRHHRRRHHLRVRRNPPFRGLTELAMQGIEDAVWITVGQVANRSLLKVIPALPATWSSQMQSVGAMLVQGAGAVAVGWASEKVAGREVGRFVLAGALTSALQNGIKAVVPAAAPLLGDYPGWMMGYAHAPISGYARAPISGYAKMQGYGPRPLVASPPNRLGDLSPEATQWALSGQE